MKDHYLLKYPNGNFVGVDMSNGGHPFETGSPSSAQYWPTRVDAAIYKRSFEKLGLTICKVQFVIKEDRIIPERYYHER